jgi:hypothetical protein
MPALLSERWSAVPLPVSFSVPGGVQHRCLSLFVSVRSAGHGQSANPERVQTRGNSPRLFSEFLASVQSEDDGRLSEVLSADSPRLRSGQSASAQF